jgi:eukaryotic-like serine/threonine-protein kinase
MQTQPQQCDANLLQRSLDDSLTQQQEECLAAHLTHCSACRETLSSLAAEPTEWDSVEQALRVESGTHSVAATEALSGSNGNAPLDFAVTFLSPSDQKDAIGQLNDIHIRSVLGHGGNGIVLKGYQPELNRLVAVKVMAPHLATSAAARQRFAREAQAAAAIVHPTVMPILSVDSSGQLPYLVMPYVDCETLQQRLDRDGRLPTIDILRIGIQVAAGLAAAHAQGLVHRDVKPANILLERGVDRVLLTDFGLARAADDASLTRSGLIAGTPQYMSPEQARGDAIDVRSDLFSLGSVLYCMCTGHPPFRAETSYGILRRVTDDEPRSVCQISHEVPSWLETIILRLLAKAPEQRFASASDVERILMDCLAHAQHPQSHDLPSEVLRSVPVMVLLTWKRIIAAMFLVSFTAAGFAVFQIVTDGTTTDKLPYDGRTASTTQQDQTANTEWPTDLESDIEDLKTRTKQFSETLHDW